MSVPTNDNIWFKQYNKIIKYNDMEIEIEKNVAPQNY